MRSANWCERALTENLALYVHWPFCVSKCPYCDFNSHVRDAVDHARWRRALLAELGHWAEETRGREVGSIFFGGGTPSLMEPETVAAVIDEAASRWRLADDVEITLEANPNSADATRFAAYRKAGVNRVSLGVQSLDDAALRMLGRAHDAREALSAVEIAARIFPRFSFDLIYARPGQTVAAWRDELDRALTHAGDHLSVYQLTIEKGTPFFAAHRKGELKIPDEDLAAALYETTQDVLAARGMPAYEISNHALPGQESRHNLAYWRSDDYAGIGPGAHGRVTRDGTTYAIANRRAPEAWLEAVERDGLAAEERRAIPSEERLDEVVMMGLRIAEGISRSRFRARTGRDIEDAFDAARLQALIDGGFLMLDETGLRATPEGRMRLNAVLAALLS
jgi:oxygen-independent coproporphyrinogen-3 oxidase